MQVSMQKAPKNHLAVAVTYVIVLFITWTGAWLLSAYLEEHGIMQSTSFARFLYWTVMRVLFWFLPSVLLLRRSGKKLGDVLSLGRIKPILLWGGGVGLFLALEITVTKLLCGQEIFSWELSWSLLTVVIIAPVIEEFTFRGAVLDAFQTRLKFWPANFITGVLFMLIHFPGWYFQGVLAKNLLSPLRGAVAILLLGVLFGFATRQSKSVSGGILTHVLNNLFSSM